MNAADTDDLAADLPPVFSQSRPQASAFVPSWATPEEVTEHGSFWLCVFDCRSAFEHWRDTGELLPTRGAREHAQQKARHASDPIAARRYNLQRKLQEIRRSVRDAQRKLDAAATERATARFPDFRTERVIATQTARLAERTAALVKVETELAAFNELHPKDNPKESP